MVTDRTSSTGWSILGRGLRSQWRDATVGSLLGGVHQVCEALVAVVIGATIDRAVLTGDGAAAARWLVALGLLFATLATSAAFGYFRMDRAGRRITTSLQIQVADRVLDDTAISGGAVRSGEVLSLASSDASRAGEIVEVIGGAFVAVAALITGLVFLFASAWQLGLVVLIGLPVVVAGSTALAAPLSARSQSEQEAVADASSAAIDLIRGLRALQGLGMEQAGLRRYRAVSTRARDARVHAARWHALHDAVTSAVAAAFVVVLAWVGGRLALDGTISVGTLVAAVGLAQFLTGPVAVLLGVPAGLSVARTSADRIARLLAAPPAVPDGTGTVAAQPGTVELIGISHRGLRGLSLNVDAGSLIGVAPSTRSEADALVEILARRADPSDGTYLVSGQRARSIDLTDLRRHVRVSDHDAALFEGSVSDNVYAAAASRPGAVDAAAAAALVDLPGGTPVGERGRRLSGGQRQRVALARAVATGAPVLVLHEPTSALDSATEAEVAARLPRARRGGTTILVTTSPALLAVCDRVVLLADGVVAAEGTHGTLTERDHAYRELVLR